MASIQKTKNGQYKIFYTHPITKKRTSKSPFNTKEEAWAWYATRQEVWKQDIGMKYSTFVENGYLPDYSVRVRPDTVATFLSMYRTHLKPYFGDTPICDITPMMVREFENQLIREGYKWGYIHAIHAAFSKVWNFGMRLYSFPTNPARLAGEPKKSQIQSWEYDPNTEENEQDDVYNVWTPEEFKAAMDEIITRRIEWTAFHVQYASGCRPGECMALQVRDYNRQTGTIRINKTYKQVHGQDVLARPKTPSSVRTVVLPPSVCRMLNDYIDYYIYKPCPSDRLFPTNKTRLSKAIRYAAEKAGVKPIPAKNLRHSHASYLINIKDAPIGKVSARLGHTNIETTLRVYARWFNQDNGELAELVDEIWEEAV